jgi:hypothetical protein
VTTFNYAIPTKAAAHGRLYQSVVRLSLTGTLWVPDSWLVGVLEQLSSRANLTALAKADFGSFRRLLSKLLVDDLCLSLLALPCEKVSRTEMRKLFEHVESILIKDDNLAASIKARTSIIFRRWMIDTIPGSRFAEDLTRHPIIFRTSLNGKFPPRRTLSVDLESYPQKGDSPIDATRHSNSKALRLSLRERLDFDANRLIDCCIAELDFWEKIRHAQIKDAKELIPSAVLLCARLYLTAKNPSGDANKGQPPKNGRQFSGACKLICDEQDSVIKLSSGMDRSAFGLWILKEAMGLPDDRIVGTVPRKVLRISQRAIIDELTAAFVLLLTYTGWNAATLRELSVAQIQYDGDIVSLTSFKPKTGDDTPALRLDLRLPGLRTALDLLHWNNASLISQGLLGKEDGRGWYTWTNSRNASAFLISADFSRSLKAFCIRYNLRAFSLEQVRTHMLVRLFMHSGTAEASRVAGGHLFIDTTAQYLDQFVLRIINRATNLEFQRRLEAVIVFPDREINNRSGLLRHPNGALSPVGDGTLCVTPRNPPNSHWLRNGLCDAHHCHANGGCDRNRIHVDEARVEEIYRWNKYYERNWKRLWDTNPEQFMTYHGPSMLFNLALMSYLRGCLFWPEIEALIPNIRE